MSPKLEHSEKHLVVVDHRRVAVVEDSSLHSPVRWKEVVHSRSVHRNLHGYHVEENQRYYCCHWFVAGERR